MAIGTKTNFRINNPFIYTGYTEMLTQFSDAFNESSLGSIRLTAESVRGEASEETFFQNIAGLISERNPASVADVSDKELTMGALVEVKLNRRVGPVAHTYDSFRKIGLGGNDLPNGNPNVQEASGGSGIDVLDMVVGQQTAKAVQVEKINTTLRALAAAMGQVAEITYDGSAEAAGFTNFHFVRGLAKMGDTAAQGINIWIMHSAKFFQLVENQMNGTTEQKLTDTGFVLVNGGPITMNRPVLLIDSPSLVIPDAGGAGIDHYLTLGLGRGAAEVVDSEDMMLASQLITGKENLAVRLQGEYSYNMGIKGFAYDLASGGVNPGAAAIGTAANWDRAFASHKDLGGVVVRSL